MYNEQVINTPVNYNIVKNKIKESNLTNVGRASIREILTLINSIETETGFKFIRMEMGIPGLPSASIGLEAEIKALKSEITSKYPHIEGVPELKHEISRFVKLFLDVDVPATSCIPCIGSTNGSFDCFLVVTRMYDEKDTVLFLDPGFPVHKMQLQVLGMKQKSLDVYDYRGEKLRVKLEEILSGGDIAALLYSNPNNPTWICFTDKELRIIGELANKYNCVVLEDLAYLNMDFRKDYSKPGEAPHQPTVAQYTDKYILLISSSKIFSYAGQRIGCMAISKSLFHTHAPGLKRFYTTDQFGHALIYGAAYAVSAGVTHSAQYALAAMLKASNDGYYNFVDAVRIYGERAKAMKKIFTENGFKIVYDKDDGVPIAHGFYFTVSFPGFTGEELIEELLYYGVSAISLSNTGSTRKEGIRACVSLVRETDIPELERRIKLFHENHKTR